MAFTKLFTSTMKEFLNKLRILKKDDVIFEDAYNNFCMASRLDSQNVVVQFNEYVSPYKGEIRDKNENFFLNFDYSVIDGSDGVDTYSKILANIWKGVSEESKVSIWKYLEVLVCLSSKACEAN